MKQYRRIFSNFAQVVLAYKANFFFTVISRSLAFAVIIFVWQAIYSQTGEIKGFTFNELITYFVIIALLSNLVENRTFEEIKEDVKTGKIANQLILPINSFYMSLVRTVARQIVFTVIFLLIAVVLFLVFDSLLLPYNLVSFFLFLLMLIIAILMNLVIFTLIGSVAFWTVETGNLVFSFIFIMEFLAGRLIPVQFFPEYLSMVVRYLPFASLFNLPPSIYLGKFTSQELYINFAVQISWLIFLFFLTKFVWGKGLNKLELV